jgi:hypothetical protein
MCEKITIFASGLENKYMLKEILSVTGKPGLFKRISQGKNMLIAESLLDGKRIPLYQRDKVVSLNDISIYSTEEEDKLLREILVAIRTREEGKNVEFDSSNPEKMKEYFASVFPEFDRDRVYPSDIKKILNWYNLLVSKGLTDFEPKSNEDEDDAKKSESNEFAAKTPKKTVAAAPHKDAKKKGVDKSRRIKQG